MLGRAKAWIQDHQKDVTLFILLFLVSTISFGLGYLIAGEYNRSPIIIEKNSVIP